MEQRGQKELTPIQKFGRALTITEWVLDSIAVLLFMGGLCLVFLGLHEGTLPEQGFIPYLSRYIPSMADLDQVSAAVGEMVTGAVLMLISTFIFIRTRLPHKF